MALCLVLAIFGATPISPDRGYLTPKTVALVFTLGLAATGASFLLKSARPGEPGRKPLVLITLLFVGILLAGLVALMLAPPAARGGMILAAGWLACLICIPLLAAAPFAALVWALRTGAPTSLRWTGAAAGLVAGAVAAAAFAFHRPADSLVFIALWYSGPIILCALIGALLGPRLLRWWGQHDPFQAWGRGARSSARGQKVSGVASAPMRMR